MDLKLENLLLGRDYVLKIADFDLSHFESDKKILSKGTKYYRGPEVREAKCTNTKAADIYAAGVILFTFKTRGILPHSEDNLVNKTNFSALLHSGDAKFWTKHIEIQKKDLSFFDEDFKELFIGMTKVNPEDRMTLDMIKKSKWYNGPSYTPEELKNRLAKVVGF
jgi:carbon catabolite-derepressing protein kinase